MGEILMAGMTLVLLRAFLKFFYPQPWTLSDFYFVLCAFATRPSFSITSLALHCPSFDLGSLLVHLHCVGLLVLCFCNFCFNRAYL